MKPCLHALDRPVIRLAMTAIGIGFGTGVGTGAGIDIGIGIGIGIAGGKAPQPMLPGPAH